MLHHSKLGDLAKHFPKDRQGNVPDHRDHWSHMDFDHGEHDPDEPGISQQERERRIAYLDAEWWPKILAQVNEQKKKFADHPHEGPVRQWVHQVMKEPPEQHGFEAAEQE